MGEPVSRQQSILQRVQSKYSFFNENVKSERMKLLKTFLTIYLIIAVGCLGVFSIYWGSMYRKDTRNRNLKMLVVLEDQEINNIPPIFSQQMRQILETPEAKTLGGWDIFNMTEFQEIADKHNNTIDEEVIRQVHHQHYWSTIYIKQNSTYNIYQALKNGEEYNTTDLIYSYFETGRHLTNIGPYVVASVAAIQTMWLDTNSVMQSIIEVGNITLDNPGSINTATQALSFTFVDMKPLTNDVLVAALQIGLLYLVIVSFFNFNFFADVHQSVAQIIKKPHFMGYRIIASIVSYFVISLMFGLVCLAFQIDFAKAFGKSGFLVYWMVTFLTMWAVGLASELAAMLLIPLYPPLMGFWLIFWVIINITPTFTPMALLPQFFRYGYAMPLHNAFEIYCVIFFDTYKGQIGRNIGIIIAWCVFLTAMTPLVLMYFGKMMGKKAAKAAQQAAKEK
ncbi:SNG1 Nitrosoguanidine resistance protein SNG1 [Candida maltosa Xu316]